VTVLVTGGRGQLGRALTRRGGADLAAFDLPELDICDVRAVAARLDELAPSAVINAAAYTAVDKAESEVERAFAINRDGVATLAAACAERSIRLIHVSTDYVFDGAATTPYREGAPLHPLGVYGESKAAGELSALAAGAVVVRTSWLFGQGGPSFVHTMLRLAAERPVLRVVADQHGCPTWADDLADALLVLARSSATGTYHYCNAGATTWHAFAVAIVAEARRYRTLVCERIEPITTAEYPVAAKRPPYAVLDTHKIQTLGIVPPPWTIGLARVIAEV
jgi:dTDP-4-dehydrorhamnose reductase